MRTAATIKLNDMAISTIQLGFVGESNHNKIVFDCEAVFSENPSAIQSITVTPPVGDPYPVVSARVGNNVEWIVGDSDVAVEGDGKVQLTFVENSETIKSYEANTTIMVSSVPGQEPTAIADWITAANATLEEVDEAIPTGGTKGQVLAKASNADRDTEWVSYSGSYNDMSDKPQIEGVTLSGDVSLQDLGAAAAEDIPDVSGFYTKPASGIPASDLATGVIPDVSGFYSKPQTGIPATDIADGVIPDVSGFYTKPSTGIPASDLATGVIPDVSGYYTKPTEGIPDTDMSTGVRTSLGKADSAYQKPGTGIPAGDLASGVIPDVSGFYTKPSGGIPDTDLSSGVQTSLGKADSAYQKPGSGIPASDLATGVIPDPTEIIDDTAGDGATQLTWSADKIKEETDELKGAIENVTEDYGTQYEWIPVTIASPLPVKENYRCADSRGAKVGKTYDQATEGYTSSSVTSCVMSAFTCESGKKYRLTVTNGQTPAKTAERGTIVIAKDYNSLKNVVLEAFRTTNTSNATDVFEFTPTEPGYVYFNLDANFQSIAVEVESVVGSSKTAVDDVVRNHVLNREITPEFEFESGTFDTTLADTSGSGYRSQIITGVKDCAICIKVDPDYTAMFGNGTDALVTVHGSYVYHSTKDAVRLWASDTVANSGLEIRIYKEKGHRCEFDVIVAASDSSDVDKQIADIVCDGTNDEIDLQFAVNWNFYREIGNSSRDSVNVLLLPGNYYIDNFETKETLHGDDTVAQYAVMVGNDSFSGNAGYYYSASISGVSKTGHITNGAVTKINVTNGAVATLSDNVENVLIGVCRAGSRAGGGIHMNALCIEVKNLSIYTNGGSNKIVALDGYTAGTSIFENNDVWSVASTSSWTPTSISEIPSGSIGIRAGDGSCYGVRQSIKGNRISGYHEGVAIVGEHFIIQDNLELRCTYGFTVNQYEHNGANQHPNVFIGNSVEQCYTMGRLGSYTSKQTLVYIGGSVENMIGNTGGEDVAMLPIEVSYDTKYRGRIESDSLVSPYDESMFESGKGTGFEQVIYPYTQA